MKFGAGGTAVRGNPLTPQRHSSPYDDVAVAAGVLGIHPDLADPWNLNPNVSTVKTAFDKNPEGLDKKEAYDFLKRHAYEQQWGTSNTAYGSGVAPQRVGDKHLNWGTGYTSPPKTYSPTAPTDLPDLVDYYGSGSRYYRQAKW